MQEETACLRVLRYISKYDEGRLNSVEMAQRRRIRLEKIENFWTKCRIKCKKKRSLPVHEPTGAGFQKGTTEDANVVLSAVSWMWVIAKLFWTLEFKASCIATGAWASRCYPLTF